MPLIPVAIVESAAVGETELDYVELTTDVSVTATTGPAAVTVISSSSLALDGSTRICIEINLPAVQPGVNASGADVILNIWDDSTDLGRIGQYTSGPTETVRAPISLKYFLTPSAGTRPFHLKAWRTNANGTILATAGTFLPAFMRITSV